MDRLELLNHLEQLVQPVLADLGLALVDLEFVAGDSRGVLRLRIERPSDGNATVEDCTNVSRALSPVLDVENAVPGSYVLEVSSPGSDRPLKRRDDFVRFVGHTIEIRARNSAADGRRNYKGELTGVQDAGIVVVCDNQEFTLPFGAIERARLADPIVIGKRKNTH